MTIVIIIVLLIHRIILYPPILSLSYSLLFCCYTHQPPLSLFLSVRDICLCQHHRLLYGSLILYCLVYCILLYVLRGVTLVKEQMVAKKSLLLMTRIFDHFSALLVKDYLATTRN